MKLTRRQVAAAIAAVSTGAGAAVGQTQPAADDLTAARDRLKANANALSSVPLPMSTEPAVQFKA
jgi:hypothetical protein